MLKKSFFAMATILLIANLANAQVPQLINYQGILIDPTTGLPIPDDVYTITFSIYNVASGGSIIWTETHNVTTKDGLYSVLLGTSTPLTPTILSGPEKYLGIKVGGDPEMRPLKRIVSVAYAYISETVSGVSNIFPSDGNVGIGAPTPTEKLQVAGTIHSAIGGFKFPDGSVQTSAAAAGGNTLDQAYDQGGPGAGRIIHADVGSFEVGGTDGALFRGSFGAGSLPLQGAGTRMMWYPAKSALRVGTLTTGGSTFWDQDSIGEYSVAMGYDNRAIGSYSTAMGIVTRARGVYSTAIGNAADASGAVSTAMGRSTTASGDYSTAMGRGSTASGDYSTAMGYNTSAGGIYSTAMGTYTNAETYATVAIGRYNVDGGHPTAWVAKDPIFEIGIGTGIYDRANAMTVLKSGKVGIGTPSPDGDLHVDGINGVLFTGIDGSGIIPVEGEGTRMMWYPGKSALRVGTLSATGSTFWDEDSIGLYSNAIGADTRAIGKYSTAFGRSTRAGGDISTAIGAGTIASGNYSTAMGYSSTANGSYSTALGFKTRASGNYSHAMGEATTASGDYSTAMGTSTTASGYRSTAMGTNTTASAAHSTAMGTMVSISGAGSFIIGDNSATTVLNKTYDDRFYGRFANGYYLYTNSTATIGAYLNTSANSWASISDSTKKENFKPVEGESILNKISQFNLGTWNYIGQDPQQYRHYGPMAQDFFAAFGNDGIGTIGNDTTLSSADFDGINFIAIQALEKRTSQLQKENEQLRNKISQLENLVAALSENWQKLQAKIAMSENQDDKSDVVKNPVETSEQ
jgi:hypothetical protein